MDSRCEFMQRSNVAIPPYVGKHNDNMIHHYIDIDLPTFLLSIASWHALTPCGIPKHSSCHTSKKSFTFFVRRKFSLEFAFHWKLALFRIPFSEEYSIYV